MKMPFIGVPSQGTFAPSWFRASGVLLALGGLICCVPNARAQEAASAPASEVAPSTQNPVVNVPGRSKAASAKRAGAKAQAYTPIQPPADDGLIPEIDMFVGESRVFPTPRVARIAVGNGSLLTAAPLDGKEVLLFANGAGTSSLFIWNDEGQYQRLKVNITAGDTSKYAREIAAFLTGIPNAKASVIGDKVIVEGDNLSDADQLKVSKLAERYPQIVNFTNAVGWEKMIMLDVKVVEFPTSVLRSVGLKWTPTGGAAVGAIWSPGRHGSDGPFQIDIHTGGGGTAPPITAPGGEGAVLLPRALNVLSALNMGFNAQLNLLAQDGRATVLAEPQLTARNGAAATFLAGGEIPYSSTSVSGTTIQFKSYGIKLNIEPKVDRNGVVRAKFEAEVSAVDPSIVSTVGGPALSTRRTTTEFNVHAGETFVLSGLLQRSLSTDIEKIPFLGDIPVLGALFRSKQFQNKETELVIFVTPTIVEPQSPAMADRVRQTQERLESQLGSKPYLTNSLQPGQDMGALGQGASAPAPAAPAAPHDQPSADTEGSVLQVRRDGLPLYAQPTSHSAPLLQLGEGSFVRLGALGLKEERGTLWRNVVVGRLDGWVVADGLAPRRPRDTAAPESANTAYGRADQNGPFVALQAGPTSKSSPTIAAVPGDAALPFYRTTLPDLAMRVVPDVNAALVAQLREGEIVKRLPDPPQGYWVAVEARGQKGWVASQWLSLQSEAATQTPPQLPAQALPPEPTPAPPQAPAPGASAAAR